MDTASMLKIATIVLSAASIPIIVLLIREVAEDVQKKRSDTRVAYVLLFLFTVLLGTAILSLFISTISYTRDNHIFLDGLDLTHISRWRSFLFALGNFLTSFSFYLITRGHYKKGGD